MCRCLKKSEFCSLIKEILNFLTHLIRDSYFLGVSRGTLRLPARKFRPDFCIPICDQRGLKTSKIDAARRERSIPQLFLWRKLFLCSFSEFLFFQLSEFFQTCTPYMSEFFDTSYPWQLFFSLIMKILNFLTHAYLWHLFMTHCVVTLIT